ncbi:MAG: phosphotransferase [Pirellulaceae bacterium]|nr:phosphotransferase [Pirellulaceae bacterium]
MLVANETELISDACDLAYVNDMLVNEAALEPVVRGLQVQSACVLRHKVGKRCLIRYTGTDARGADLVLLGKIRFKGLDHVSAAVQRELYAAGFNGSDGLSVPRVYGELPLLRMWIQEFVADAVPMTVSSSEFVSAQHRVACAVARLHQTSMGLARHHTVGDELALLQNRFDQLRRSRPELVGLIDSLQDTASRIAEELSRRTLYSTIHRDFYFDQVLYSDSQVVLVDWDQCCLGPPELDVGNYVGHLRELAIRTPQFAEACGAAEEVFMGAYFKAMQPASRAAAELWANLTLARHVSLSTLLPNRSHTTIALAEQALLAKQTLLAK